MTKEFIIHTGAFGSEMDIINKYAGTVDITGTEGSKPERIAENPWVRESLIWARRNRRRWKKLTQSYRASKMGRLNFQV